MSYYDPDAQNKAIGRLITSVAALALTLPYLIFYALPLAVLSLVPGCTFG